MRDESNGNRDESNGVCDESNVDGDEKNVNGCESLVTGWLFEAKSCRGSRSVGLLSIAGRRVPFISLPILTSWRVMVGLGVNRTAGVDLEACDGESRTWCHGGLGTGRLVGDLTVQADAH